MPTRLTQTGAEVQDDLYKIEDIGLATEEKEGLMSPEDKTKLDNIDAEIPTKLSDLEDDSMHRTVTDTEKQTWNNKSDFSGRYQDLTGRPYIPQRTSDLRNDSGFITKVVEDLANYYLKSEVYTKAEVAALIASIQGFSVKVVDVLPTASEETMRAIYLVPSVEPQAGNTKDEWITVEDNGAYRWEQIGSTAISLDGYVTDDELTAALADYTTTADLTTLLSAKYEKPVGGIPSSDMTEAVQTSLGRADSAYQKPSDGIPSTDIASGVIPDVSGFYTKPSGGIPSTDLSSAVQTSLGKADTALQSHQDISGKADKVTGATNGNFAALDSNGNLTDSGHKHSDYLTSFTETDPIFSASAASGIVASDITAWNGKYTKPSGGIPKTDLASAVQTSLGKADTAMQSFTETDPTVPSWAKAENPPTEVFVAEYGVTTYVEIAAAITAEKICTVVRSGDTHSYILVNGASNYMRFVATDGRYIYEVRCYSGDNHWIYTSTTLQITGNIVTSWQSTPDDTHYPSEKLVKDSLDAKADIDALGKRGVVSQTQTWTGGVSTGYTYTMSDQVWGLIPQANIDLYESAGAVFNETTGYFELNGLTDISYEEMQRIYSFTISLRGGRGRVLSYALSSLPVRTSLPILRPNNVIGVSFDGILYPSASNRGLESVRFEQGDRDSINMGSNLQDSFRSGFLKEILPALNVAAVTNFSRTFNNAVSLVSVFLEGLKTSVSFEDSPNLSLESVIFAINNASTSAVTITLHATAYARAIADADVQTALSNHTNVTLASN